MNIWDEIDAVENAKEEYLKGDIIMSELLRNHEFYGLTSFSKNFLLKWAGEDEFMKANNNGDICEIDA